MRIDNIELALSEIKDKLVKIDQKVHDIEAQILVKEKMSEAWLRNTAVIAGVATFIGGIGTIYYFFIESLQSHLTKLIH